MRRLFLLALLATVPTFCFGETTQKTFIHSNILNEDRQLWVNVPEYYELRKDSFHLILLFDGNNRSLFDYAVAAKRFLERNAVDLSEFNAPESIVVGIGQRERWNDFADQAGSAKFLNFLTSELLPFIRKNYRVQSYTILIGHSLAGRFSINALLQRPDLFNAVIAASPAFGKDLVEDIRNKIDSLGKSKLADDRALFISTTYMKDDGTEAQFREFAEAMNRQFKESEYHNLRFQFDSSDTLGHAKSPYFSIPEGLHFVYSPALWQLDVKSLFDKNSNAANVVSDYRQRIKEKFGIEISTYRYTPILIDELTKANKTDEVVRILKQEADVRPMNLDSFANLIALLKKNKSPEYAVYKLRFINVMRQMKIAKDEQTELLETIEKSGRRQRLPKKFAF